MLRSCTVGESEVRSLSAEELKAIQDADRPRKLQVRDFNPALLQSLYKRGLIYLDVPIRADDHVSIPPLEVRNPYL